MAARFVRAGVLLAPVTVAACATWIVGSGLGRPAGALAIAWWVAMLLLATVVYVAVERVARVLLPLPVMLRLSLSFPDQTPSRFRLALRAGSTRRLKDAIEMAKRGERGDTPAEAAEQVLSLVAALNIHDRTTRGHSERVRAYAEVIGRELELDERQLVGLRWAALLHDIGKIAVPAKILNKRGKLTDEEFEIIKIHPSVGADLVEPLRAWIGDSIDAVLLHHERFSGGGYPTGIAGQEISYTARIVAVADTFDVITSTRSYKEPMSTHDALTEISRCSGSQFDPTVVRALLNVSLGRLWLAGGPLTWVASVPGLARVPAVGSAVTAFGNASLAGVAIASAAGGLALTQAPMASADTAPLAVASASTQHAATPGGRHAGLPFRIAGVGGRADGSTADQAPSPIGASGGSSAGVPGPSPSTGSDQASVRSVAVAPGTTGAASAAVGVVPGRTQSVRSLPGAAQDTGSGASSRTPTTNAPATTPTTVAPAAPPVTVPKVPEPPVATPSSPTPPSGHPPG